MIGDSQVNVSWYISKWFDARIHAQPRPLASAERTDHDILLDLRMKTCWCGKSTAP